MKIRSRNLLTTVLAMLCALAFAIGVSFAMPKMEAKTAMAKPNGYPLSDADLGALSSTAGFEDIESLIKKVKKPVLSAVNATHLCRSGLRQSPLEITPA